VKILYKGKDGGLNSNVTGYWLIEVKSLFSVALLRFDKGSREEFHNHAFSAVSWILKGALREELLHTNKDNYLTPSVYPVYTSRKCFHRVHGLADNTWVLSIRGPWNKLWNEYNKNTGTFTTLTNGRKIVSEKDSNS
jgi:hypothetical protein